MFVIGVIPARMASSRYPGKPLVPILGQPMIYHVWRRVLLSGACDKVVVATCDEEIVQAAQSFGAETIMTSANHLGANDRVAEVANLLECDAVVNIQGDEPLVHPQLVTDVVHVFRTRPDVQCVNPVARISTETELVSRNTVKAVQNMAGRIIYFSRAVIPSATKNDLAHPVMRQVPIIGLRADFAIRLAGLTPGPLELLEGIDLLRAIEHDLPIHALETEFQTFGVDTKQDHEVVETKLQSDPIYPLYADETLTSS